jgi:release factor glutamine methyltransferase
LRLLGKDQIHFYHGDLFEALTSREAPSRFSFIVSNPPYIPSALLETLPAEVKNEPSLALDGGPDGLEIIRRIIKNAPSYLADGGILLLEADPHQMEKIAVLLDINGFYDVKLYKDLSGQERVITGKYEKKT